MDGGALRKGSRDGNERPQKTQEETPLDMKEEQTNERILWIWTKALWGNGIKKRWGRH